MQAAVSFPLAFFTFLCLVKCQLVQFVENHIKFEDLSNNSLPTSVSGGNSHFISGLLDPAPFHQTSSLVLRPPSLSFTGGSRVRRATRIGWNHKFVISATHSFKTQSEVNRWDSESDILKINLKEMDFQFYSPTGLTILFSDFGVNMEIVDLRFKVNEEFRDGRDGGHYKPDFSRQRGLMAYTSPKLKAKQGDVIYYWIDIKLGTERFTTVVKGQLTITQGNPHSGQDATPTTQSTSTRPQYQIENSASQSVEQQGGSQLALSWEHRININTKYSGGLPQSSVDRLLDDVQRFKKALKNDIEFRFYDPKGFGILIKGDAKDLKWWDENVKILGFYLKINKEIGTDAPENYWVPEGRLDYFFRELKVDQGDKLFYWMKAELGKQNVANIVQGVLEIKKGDPHIGGPRAPPRPTTQRPTQAPTTQRRTQPPTTQRPTQPPTTQRTTQPPTTQRPTLPPTTQRPTQPPTTQSTSPPTTRCYTSLTTVSVNGDTTPPCQGQILLEQKFYNLDGWTHRISIGGEEPEDEFTIFTRDEDNAWVQQRRLYIKPTLLEEKANDSFVRGGNLILPGCTLSHLGSRYCHRKAQGYTILPPITSARINSQNSFTFRYGIVEIRAKLPRGDWIVPELWLEPTNSAVKEKMILGLATGNMGNTSTRVAAGVVRTTAKRLNLLHITGSSPWFQGFHTFKLEWTPDNVKFYVDNQKIEDLPGDAFQIFRQDVYISLGIHAAGYRDFPADLFPNRPWEEDDDVKRFATFWDEQPTWYPSWQTDPTLQVASIRVKAL